MAGAAFHGVESSVAEWPEWRWFGSIEQLLSDALAATETRDYAKVGALYPFLDSVIESAASLRSLASELKLRDSYVIARVIYETAVNACFLLTDPTALSSRATTHAKQKALRNLVRAVEIAGDRIFEFSPEGAERLLDDPGHQALLNEFTSKSGREITSWTPENVQLRVEAVYLKFGPDVTRGMAFGLLLYRHASEIAHGSLYGTLFSWGAMEGGGPLKRPEDIGKFRRKELRHLLKLVSFSLETLLRVSSPVLETPAIALAACQARTEYYDRRGQQS